MEIRSDGDPYYHVLENVESGEVTWELVYPIAFYESICNEVISGLRAYYVKDRIDPYSCFAFGTYWIDELNR